LEDQEKEVLEDIMEDLEKESKEKKPHKTEEEVKKEHKNEKTSEKEEKETEKEVKKEEKSEEKKAAESSTEKEDQEEDREKKSFFGKKDKKDPLKEKLDEMQDKYMRQVAEFDNFRKRTDKEKAQMFDAGASSVLEKILPIVDNFERGLATIPEDQKDSAFADGMNKIYKQLVKQLEDLGVKPIDAQGTEFDPNFHNAVMQVDSEEVESGYVAQELQKGYMFHDTVLRHSMVSVAK
jgi:molecular chaperone GrpE